MGARYDRIILGAGLYGLYSALISARKRETVLVLEYDSEPFRRATCINQARVHMGYHYPRSYSTATKSAGYFEKFNSDFHDCIHSSYTSIYAISSALSWTSAEQFEKFCMASNIPCDAISPNKHFKEGLCEGAFITKEYSYDAGILLKSMLQAISHFSNVDIRFNSRIKSIERTADHFNVYSNGGESYSTDFLINTTYASVNQVLKMLDFTPFRIKYEICEIILCDTNDELKNLGITVMDGPFFSIMPFGKTGLHSLTSVTFTPHKTSLGTLPAFACQERSDDSCSPGQLGNCNYCAAKPETAWRYMSSIAKKYLREELGFEYRGSLFSIKPILRTSEIDDSRHTVIWTNSDSPKFISVLSGKINTIYDLDEAL